jgi:peptide/nickel transport system ATP-binding protein
MAQHRMGTRTERQDRVGELLELVGLDASFAERFPGECSGGELQRVVIARALSLNPRLLICDEPTAALDASNRAQILNVLEELKQQLNLSLIMISHDLRLIALMSDRIAVMYLGQIIELSAGEHAFNEPLHPYTRQLIEASQLGRSKLGKKSGIVDGEPPSPVDPPKGCHFHPRCPLATNRCTTEVPELLEVRKGRWVACFRWDMAAADL